MHPEERGYSVILDDSAWTQIANRNDAAFELRMKRNSYSLVVEVLIQDEHKNVTLPIAGGAR
jgi:hypothetical protein